MYSEPDANTELIRQKMRCPKDRHSNADGGNHAPRPPGDDESKPTREHSRIKEHVDDAFLDDEQLGEDQSSQDRRWNEG